MSPKSTVIIFSTFYEPWMSGAERCVKEVVERLTPRYHFVLFAARISRSVPAREQRDGFEIRRVGIGHAQLDKWLFCILAPLAALQIKAIAVHAIMESYAGIALWVFGFLKPRTPRILTLQSGDLDSAEKQRRIPGWLWARVHRTPHRVTAISNFLAARALRLGATAAQVSVIPNGVDLSRITPRDPAQRVLHRIVCVARLSWEKGLPHLLDALALVRKNVPDAHLVLVGEGILRGELTAQVARLGLQDAVTFRGNLPNTEALAVMQTGHVFACPSLAEGLGIVFIEAQAAGVPVIGTSVGGIPDVIADGETGLLVPPKDSVALAHALERFLTDDALGARCVAEAVRRLPRFDWARIIEQFVAIYRAAAMPRVALAASIYPPDIGGPASQAAAFVAAWTARGHQVSVVAPGRNTVPVGETPHALVYRGPQGKWGYFVALFRIAATHDVLFAQDASAYSILALLVARLRRVPFVVRLGGDLLWERDTAAGRAHLGLTAYYTTGAWKRAPLLYRAMQRIVVRGATRCVFPNELLPTLYRAVYGAVQAKVVRIANPIRSCAVTRTATPQRRFLVCGRLVPLKNILATMEVLAAVRRAEPEQPFSVLVIGDGPLRGALDAWKDDQHADWLEIRPSEQHETLCALIADSRCVLQLSWSEVSPNGALEALRIGTPVLLTSDNGLARSLAPYATLVDPFDQQAVHAAIREMLTTDGYERAVQRAALFAWPQTTETMLEQYETLFTSLSSSAQ